MNQTPKEKREKTEATCPFLIIPAKFQTGGHLEESTGIPSFH